MVNGLSRDVADGEDDVVGEIRRLGLFTHVGGTHVSTKLDLRPQTLDLRH
jgi:hypothetical protein